MTRCWPLTLGLLLALCLSGSAAHTQEPPMHAGMLANALDQLATTTRVLYIAAHPDDENTRFLAYLANGRHLTTAYLSMTRGGGGQNLIGTEQGDLLGIVRTQELLAARHLDHAQQRFSRMHDFGYSKSARETLEIWGHDEALADVVWVVRTFQPDVIITRFTELPPNHGHHTASAILAREAFSAAADPTRFAEQLAHGASVWQAKRLLHNLSNWSDVPPPADAMVLDVGTYDARLGVSYGELAALSRSQHKSQGFGVPGERGAILERFVWLAGSRPDKDILAGLPADWQEFGGAAQPFIDALADARARLERDRPEQVLAALLTAHRGLDTLPDVPRVRDARRGLEAVMASAMGLFVRATSATPSAVPGGVVSVKTEVVLRRPATVALGRLRFSNGQTVDLGGPALPLNEKKEIKTEVTLAADAPIAAPYWLAQKAAARRDAVADPTLVGDPSGPAPLSMTLELSVGDRRVQVTTPVLYGWTDPVHGERLRRFLVVPPATVTPTRDAIMFPNHQAAEVTLRVRAGRDALRGEVTLRLPEGWHSEPAVVPVALAHAGDETTTRFTVQGPPGTGAVEVSPAIVVSDGAQRQTWAYREDVIDYPHIPMQGVLQPTRLRLVPVALHLPHGLVGYVQGSGDTVADDLAHVGVRIEPINDETLRQGDLQRFSAIVLGIRAYNTRPALPSAQARLMAYVEAGGTLVTQYNTNSRQAPLSVPIGPHALQIGRDRVTEERAVMTVLEPKHPLMNHPNKIAAADFDGWVQERGLYYGEKWDPAYVALLSAADQGEAPQQGGLLFARHGKGRYVYTGLSFFRQLPAGVPGAYRLFLNLLGET